MSGYNLKQFSCSEEYDLGQFLWTGFYMVQPQGCQTRVLYPVVINNFGAPSLISQESTFILIYLALTFLQKKLNLFFSLFTRVTRIEQIKKRLHKQMLSCGQSHSSFILENIMPSIHSNHESINSDQRLRYNHLSYAVPCENARCYKMVPLIDIIVSQHQLPKKPDMMQMDSINLIGILRTLTAKLILLLIEWCI